MKRGMVATLVLAVFMAGYLAGSKQVPLSSAVDAQGDCQTFTETGKKVCGDFLAYWKANGGLAQQGFPVSETFSEKSETDGKTYTVQYFERAVFEMHPELPEGKRVLLTLLGAQKFIARYSGTQPSGTPMAATAATAVAPTVVPTVAATVVPATATMAQTPGPMLVSGLRIAGSGFKQGTYGTEVSALVENGDARAFRGSRYTIVVYDTNNTVLGTTNGTIDVLEAGKRWVIDRTVYFRSEVGKASRIDVQLTPGMELTTALPRLNMNEVKTGGTKESVRAQGILQSGYPRELMRAEVSAAAFDASGKFIGGGSTSADLVPANGQAAVSVPLTYSGMVARVEVYPMHPLPST